MNNSRFSEQHIAYIFKQADDGLGVEDVPRKAEISRQTSSRLWRDESYMAGFLEEKSAELFVKAKVSISFRNQGVGCLLTRNEEKLPFINIGVFVACLSAVIQEYKRFDTIAGCKSSSPNFTVKAGKFKLHISADLTASCRRGLYIETVSSGSIQKDFTRFGVACCLEVDCIALLKAGGYSSTR